MRVLILTGKFGLGHYSASLSLRQQLTAAFPNAQVEVEDFFAYALPGASEGLYKAFQLLVTRGSALYNAFYRLTENGKGNALPVWAAPLVERMADLLRQRRPDGVIATHPLCAQLVSRCEEEFPLDIPLVTCVTDVTAHSEWLCDRSEMYLVPAPQVRDAFVEKGVPEERLRVTGIPVKEEFKLPPRREDSVERRLLIMGGGLGLLPRNSTFYEKLDALPHVKTTLITGGNQKLFHRLSGRYRNIQVLGFTNRVYDHMASAHLMLTKPGGITLFEAIFSQLPILAWEPFLEQERHNAQFLTRQGIGRVAPQEPEECLEAIQDLLYDSAALGEMSRRMADLQGELEDRAIGEWMTLLLRKKEAKG